MTKLYDSYFCFFNNFLEIKSKIHANANRSGISDDAAFMLVVLLDFPQFFDFFNQIYLNELLEKGFCEYIDNNVVLTNKGKILAKSLVILLNK